jgi:hypothetical protein
MAGIQEGIGLLSSYMGSIASASKLHLHCWFNAPSERPALAYPVLMLMLMLLHVQVWPFVIWGAVIVALNSTGVVTLNVSPELCLVIDLAWLFSTYSVSLTGQHAGQMCDLRCVT